MALKTIKIKHPHIHLAHSIYLTLFSYFNIVAFIANKQEYNHTNTIYLFSIYVSIIFILIDSFVSSLLNITSIVVYNILYISCLVNTVYNYGNILSIILFIIEATNVSIDWVIVNFLSKQDITKQNYSHNLLLLGTAAYAIVSKMIISPLILMVIYYNLSSNFSEPVFILSFCLYSASIVRLLDELKYIAGMSHAVITFRNKLEKQLKSIDSN